MTQLDNVPIRTGDVISLMKQLESARDTLKATETIAGKWILTAEKQVVKEDGGFGVKFTFAKPNGEGFIRNVSAADIAYYANSPDDLVLQLMDEIIENLYKDQIRESITPFVTLAVRNASTMQAKS